MQPTIFITGADKGLGFSLAKCFLQAGWRVFAGVYAGADHYAALAPDLQSRLTTLPLDVSQMSSVRAAAQQVQALTPALDVLLNNAGVHLEDSSLVLEDLDLEDGHLQETMAINTFGPLRVVQQFLPLLDAGAKKLILNISSEAGSIANCPRSKEFAYCMSKTALNMQSRLLQNYLGARGYKVLAVHPGWMRTDMGGARADMSPDESAQAVCKLALRDWQPTDPIYMDYSGKLLNW